MGVAVGDLNLDGKPDVVATNYGGTSVSVLLGSGSGTLGSQVAYNVGSYPWGVTIGDLNLDGNPDVVAANGRDNTVSVLLGYGDGTLGMQISHIVGIVPFRVAVGDLNLDGKPDVVVTNFGSNTVSVLLGSGMGTLGTQVSYAVGVNPAGIAVGDFNLDGKPDVVVANLAGNAVSVLLGSGTGILGTQVSYAAGTNSTDVAVGDFNLDGKPDVVVANGNRNSVSLLLNVYPTLAPTYSPTSPTMSATMSPTTTPTSQPLQGAGQYINSVAVGVVAVVSVVIGGVLAALVLKRKCYRPAAPQQPIPLGVIMGVQSVVNDAHSLYTPVGSEAPLPYAPIGITFDNNKIDLVTLNASTVAFDYLDNGIKAKTAWVGAKDAFLIYDHNDNNKVDFAKELVLTQWSKTARTDFMALKEVFDSNKDNKFDANDAEFNRFRIWQDKNQDGVSQSKELTLLSKAGLVQIDFDTEHTINGEFFGKQQEMMVAGVTWQDGHQTLAYDLVLESAVI